MRKEINIFDIDNTLWQSEKSVWLINKNNPSKPILKISETDFNLIKKGVYKSQGNKVSYNGKSFYLPTIIVNKISKSTKNLSDIGISMHEFFNKESIESLKFEIKDKNLEHIKNKNQDLFFICSRSIKDKYKKHLRKIDDKLENLGLNVSKYFYINEMELDHTTEHKKVIIILEYLTGMKIEGLKFQRDEYYQNNVSNIVNFYDNINIKNIQDIFEKIYHNTKDDTIKKDIKSIIEKNRPILNSYKVTSNDLNKFILNKITLNMPGNLMKFESFKF